jgi:hypothetical protein
MTRSRSFSTHARTIMATGVVLIALVAPQLIAAPVWQYTALGDSLAAEHGRSWGTCRVIEPLLPLILERLFNWLTWGNLDGPARSSQMRSRVTPLSATPFQIHA